MAHLQQDVTTLCTCWLITRNDGTVLGITDFDQDLTISGITYSASNSYDRSAIKSQDSMAADSVEIYGMLDSQHITAFDISRGLYDYATVQIAVYNWANIAQGPLVIRQGIFGEAIVNPTGTFKVELRGLTQLLTTDMNNILAPLCRADLGDSKCQIQFTNVPAVNGWIANTAYAVGAYVFGANSSAVTSIFRCSVAGTSGAVFPVFNSPLGATTADNTVTWTSVAPPEGWGIVSSVTSTKQFGATPLIWTMPGTKWGLTAVITFTASLNSQNVRILVGNTVNGTPVQFEIDLPYLEHDLDSANFVANVINTTDGTALGGMTAAVSSSGSNPEVILTLPAGGNNGAFVQLLQADSNNVVIQTFAEGWMNGGMVTWVSGSNAKTSMEINTFSTGAAIGNQVTLFLAMPYPIKVGDIFTFNPGCNKARLTCSDKWNNILNFRGEPDCPGSDGFIMYPDASRQGSAATNGGLGIAQ